MSRRTDDRIDRVIDELVRDARPVRRLWSPGLRLLAWVVVVCATTALVALAGLRPGAAGLVTKPLVLAEIASLGTATLAAAWIAFRASIPGLDRGRAGAILVGSLATGAVLSLAQTRPLIGGSLSAFVGAGIGCTLSSIVIAVIPTAALIWAVARGAALHAAWAGATAGLAAAVWSYLLTQLRCQSDETAHVVVWHGLAVVAVTAAAAAIAVAVERARRAGAPRA
jgi:hypothetical protein